MARSQPEWMLRINSALVLGAAALALAYASPQTFAFLVMLCLALMAWEWGRLVRGNGFDLTFAVQLAATVAASWATMLGCLSCALLAVLAGTAVAFAIRLACETPRQAWWSAFGVSYAGLPAIALIWIRGDASHGWLAILYVFLIVWTTDTAAYFAGRAIGGPKLVPRISPHKTWAGLIGGTFFAGVAGLLFGLWLGDTNPAKLAVLSFALGLIAQLGDLGESALKRNFGTKDTSGLIPGHGGVLDRIDGLIFAALAAALIAWLLNPAQPGAAILVWL